MTSRSKKSGLILSDIDLDNRIYQLNSWIAEGKKFPNNYRNIQIISDLSSNLIEDLVADRIVMMEEIKQLKKLR
jgi:hypothetical protein